MLAVISIGRNQGQVPMNADVWLDFQRHIARILDAEGAGILARPVIRYAIPCSQAGVWDDGVDEDCAIWIVSIQREKAAVLRSLLATAAHLFRQESIGFIMHYGSESTSVVYA